MMDAGTDLSKAIVGIACQRHWIALALVQYETD
jgi:hypothetical protein